MKKYRIFILFVVIAAILAGCAAKTSAESPSMESPRTLEPEGGASYDYGDSTRPGESSKPIIGKESAGNISGTTYNPADLDTQKLIKNASFEMETTDFDKSLSAIEDAIKRAGGYVQNSNILANQPYNYIRPSEYYNDRSAQVIARIPVGDLDGFSSALESAATVIRSSLNIQEVSDYYYDTEARIKSLKIQETTLLDILDKAENLTDVVTLQTALMDVRYQIESAEGTLRRLDNQIAYSTVTIRLMEVKRVSDVSKPETLGERISFEFRKSLNAIKDASEDFIVFVAGNVILIFFWLIILTLILVFIRIIVRSSHRKSMRQNFIQTKIDADAPKDEEKKE